MVTTGAVVHGPVARLLAHHPGEHPLALQLGGSVPEELARAVTVARGFGFDEVNLNVGCPSDRVQSGSFGAALMRTPALVADCVAAMMEAAGPVPVTVKCRIGVDDQDPETVLPAFLETVAGAGVRRFAIHARKAWLQGLSPKENREIPPLPYIEAERAAGTPLHAITRHMLGAFAGRPGARAWRRHLSENAHRAGAGPEVVERAIGLVAAPEPAAAD